MAFFIDFKTDFATVEFYGTVFVAFLAQYFCQPVEEQDLVAEVAVGAFDYFLRFLVGETAVRACDCPDDAVI